MNWARSFLNAAAEPARADQATKVRAFASILMMHLAARVWIGAFSSGDVDMRYLVAAILLSVAMSAVLVGRYVRPALAMATVVQLAIIATTFPEVANHRYLEALCVAALAAFDLSRIEERATLLEFLRWALVIVFFHTGLQKLMYGTYFDGQFLGHATATSNRFAMFFQFFLPADEFQRLRDLVPLEPGKGPFAVSSPLFLIISNGVWIFEMLVPPFMLWRRTRVFAVTAAVVFTLGIQFGAHELMFGLLFTNMGLLFAARAVNRWFVAPFALAYVCLALMSTGVIPLPSEFFLN